VRQTFYLLILLGVFGCTGSPIKSNSLRDPASIANFPAPDSRDYFDASTANEFFSHVKVWQISGKESHLENSFVNSPPYASELNEAFAKVDQKVRAILHYPNVPSPQLVVIRDPLPNAYVMPIDTCVISHVRIEGRSRNGLRPSPIGLIKSPLGSEILLYEATTPSMCWPLEAQDYAKVVKELGGRSLKMNGHTCTLALEKGEIVFHCPEESSRPIAMLSYSRAAPFVFVTTGFLAAQKTMAEVQAAWAHELGHYYLGHASGLTKPTNYFYDRHTSLVFRPPMAPNLKGYGENLLMLGKIRSGRKLEGYFNSGVAGELFVSGLVIAIHLNDFYGRPYDFDQQACSEFLPSGTFSGQAISRYIYSERVRPTDLMAARSEIKQAQFCARTLKIKSPDFNFNGVFRSGNKGILLVDPQLDISAAKNLWDAFQILEPSITEKWMGITADPKLREIGYYTFEEEADVFALNYQSSSEAGHQALQTSLKNVLRYMVDEWHVSSRELADCLQAADHGWTLKGNIYTPLPDDFSDPHHGLCFRLFNIDELNRKMGVAGHMTEDPMLAQAYAPIKASYLRLNRDIHR
jgi:hypothetical protein